MFLHVSSSLANRWVCLSLFNYTEGLCNFDFRLAELLSQVRCRQRSQVGPDSLGAYELGGLVARRASIVVFDPMGWAMAG